MIPMCSRFDSGIGALCSRLNYSRKYSCINRVIKIAVVAGVFIASQMIIACGGGEGESRDNPQLVCRDGQVVDTTGTVCVTPQPVQCQSPLVPNDANDACILANYPAIDVPVYFPTKTQAVLYYNRASYGASNTPQDTAYDGWKLHTWNSDICDAYKDEDTQWENGRSISGIDPNYGAYWIVELKSNVQSITGDCHHFIIHKGVDDAGKEMEGGNFSAKLNKEDPTFNRMNFTLAGVAYVYESPVLPSGSTAPSIDGASAHWLDVNTILWDAPEDVNRVKLHFSDNGSVIKALASGDDDTAIDLNQVTLTQEQIKIAPHLSAFNAYQGNWTQAQAKAILKSQIVLAGYGLDGELIKATRIQHASVLDQLYTRGDSDANETNLGPVYTEQGVNVAVWAPTASNVDLLIFDESKSLVDTLPMTENTESGVWSYDGDNSLDRALYRFAVTVYHPDVNNVTTLEVTDPYSLSLTTNGLYSRFVNLADESLKPMGWDTQIVPEIVNPEDAIIYEGHVRDFSARDASTSEAYRGKYLAFTQQDTAPINHLRELIDAGLTHFHLLPVADIASIDEQAANRVDITDTVGQLCSIIPSAEVCLQEAATTQLIEVFSHFDPITEAKSAQRLARDMQSTDSFNWGYDPHHFSVPEGSYASNAEGVERIIEMRAMIQSLHEMGLRVALDVVFNHTYASGVFTQSVLDKVVPGYYHRYDIESGAIVRETCCEDTEPRNVMMEKLMLDSLSMWTREYKVDSFRFDIMSQATKDTMVRLRDAILTIDEDNYFYGEGWTKIDRGYEQASQVNMAGTEIGTFNDRLRDAIRHGHIFNPDSELALEEQDRLKMGLAGTLSDFLLNTSSGSTFPTSTLGGYGQDPADIINYVSKHDNETLWDKLQYVLPDNITLEERVRAHNVSMALTLLSQGIVFLQMGGDILRSKSMDRDSYDSGDWFNFIDFTKNSNNWNVGLPPAEKNADRWEQMTSFIYAPERAVSVTEIELASHVFKEFLRIRKTIPLFRLTTSKDIIERIGFHNVGSLQQVGLIAMSIDDGVNGSAGPQLADIDPNLDAVMLVANTGYHEKSITVKTATGFILHPLLQGSVDPTARLADFNEGEGDDAGNGIFRVPAMTVAVFIKPQGTSRGYGLSALATTGSQDVGPYADLPLYWRASINEWGTQDQFIYQGDRMYTLTVNLPAQEVEFKIATADWETVNLGNPEGQSSHDVTLGSVKVLGRSNNNLRIDVAAGKYEFRLQVTDTETPTLMVIAK